MWPLLLSFFLVVGVAIIAAFQLFREEDYVPEGTDFATMTDEAFFFNCFKMNYGMEVVQRFTQLGPWEHIMTGVITRRPALGQEVLWIEPIVLINCDLAVPFIQVPPEVWLHAFSDSDVLTRLTDGEHPSMRSSLTVPKIVFTSQKAGFVLKVIPSFLFMLAQDRVPLPYFSLAKMMPDIEKDPRLAPLRRVLPPLPPAGVINDTPEANLRMVLQVKELDDQWREVLPLQREIARVLKGHPALDVAQVTIEIPTERIYAIVAYLADPVRSASMANVEEGWLLHVSHLGEFISPAEAVRGQHFAWECIFLRARPKSAGAGAFDDAQLRELATGWADPGNRRIRRTATVGDKYYLNTTWPWWAFFPKVKWENIVPSVGVPTNLPLRKVPPQIDPKATFRPLHAIGKPDTDLFLEVPFLAQFQAFCRSVFQSEVTLLDWRQGLLLFVDNNNKDQHYLVKVAGSPYAERGYIGTIYEYLDLFVRIAGTLRVFSLDVSKGIVETSAGWLASLLRSVGYADLENLANVTLNLRNQDLLNINLVFGDMFSPRTTQGGGVTVLDGALSIWNFIPARNVYELSFPSDRFDMARQIIKDSSEPQIPTDPLAWFALEEELMEKQPELHAQIVREYREKHGDPVTEEAEDEPRSEQEREARYWEEEANKSTAVPTRVVKEDADYIYTETIDGKIQYAELKESEEDYYGPDEDVDSSDDYDEDEEDYDFSKGLEEGGDE